jgi:type IV secretory pathway TrbF-like protein
MVGICYPIAKICILMLLASSTITTVAPGKKEPQNEIELNPLLIYIVTHSWIKKIFESFTI